MTDPEQMCHCPYLSTLMISSSEYHRHTDRIVDKFVEITNRYTDLLEKHLQLKSDYMKLKEELWKERGSAGLPP